QWAASEVSSTQTPSHGVNPALQTEPHAPEAQIGVAFGSAVTHRLPHAPQFAASATRLVSHPSAALPSQFANPASHVNPQLESQVVAAFGRSEQTFPHAEQLLMSVVVSISHPSVASLLQSANPVS